MSMHISVISSCFNPRTYIRYDIWSVKSLHVVYVFQSTYLYKVRHSSNRMTGIIDSFNPRTYIRYDNALAARAIMETVSIHVPI